MLVILFHLAYQLSESGNRTPSEKGGIKKHAGMYESGRRELRETIRLARGTKEGAMPGRHLNEYCM